MELSYMPMNDWPPLAWLARCRRDSQVVEVAHGSRVETSPAWFVEAVWDGDYNAGGFDRTDLVYGSGGTLRDDALVFVSSATTVDRLHWIEARGCVWVSNSLACLLAAVGGSVDPNYMRYFRDFETITRGVRSYQRTLASSAGPVHLTYYDNLLWHGGRISDAPKPSLKRNFSTFQRYHDFLETSLCKLARNMQSPRRAYPYEMLATMSSGYDSPCVAAVARRAGLRQSLSFSRSRDNRPDSGADIARRLGLEPLVVDSNVWRNTPLAEVPFIASDSKGEDVYYAGAADLLQGRVVLSGYGGGSMWGKGPSPPVNYERSDQAGLSLCEFRLWAGFLHCPAGYMGGRQTPDLRRISNSAEMQPWDVPDGYSRPICRRILEQAGVPRKQFGMEKKAASILLFDQRSFLSASSLADYRHWLEENCRRFNERGRLSRVVVSTADIVKAGPRVVARHLQTLAAASNRFGPNSLLGRISKSGKLTRFANHERLFAHIFPWSLEKAKQRYTTAPQFGQQDARDTQYEQQDLAPC